MLSNNIHSNTTLDIPRVRDNTAKKQPTNAGLVLVQRLRRWLNIKPALAR